jgi:hypothetical protein
LSAPVPVEELRAVAAIEYHEEAQRYQQGQEERERLELSRRVEMFADLLERAGIMAPAGLAEPRLVIPPDPEDFPGAPAILIYLHGGHHSHAGSTGAQLCAARACPECGEFDSERAWVSRRADLGVLFAPRLNLCEECAVAARLLRESEAPDQLPLARRLRALLLEVLGEPPVTEGGAEP